MSPPASSPATSRLGLGLAAAGRPAYITSGRDADLGGHRTVDDLRRRCHDLLDAALAVLRDTGVRVGISTSGAAQADAVRRAIDVQVGGRPLFTSIETTWNVLEPSGGPRTADPAPGALALRALEYWAARSARPWT